MNILIFCVPLNLRQNPCSSPRTWLIKIGNPQLFLEPSDIPSDPSLTDNYPVIGLLEIFICVFSAHDKKKWTSVKLNFSCSRFRFHKCRVAEMVCVETSPSTIKTQLSTRNEPHHDTTHSPVASYSGHARHNGNLARGVKCTIIILVASRSGESLGTNRSTEQNA